MVALPWLKQDVWIPLLASIGIDVDHYLWHAVTYRTLSLRAAIRYFGQADPQQRPAAKIFHHPIVLAALLFVALRLRSRLLLLILAGMLFHVSLDFIHVTQMRALKDSLNKQAQGKCSACGQEVQALQLHTVHVATNLLERYAPRHYVVLCPSCHELAHSGATKTATKTL